MFKRLLLASSATIALSVAFAPSAFATITQSAPQSGVTYVDSVPVSWSVTSQASSLSMVWTYTSGPYASTEDGQQITVNLASPGSTTHSSFSFSPASPTSSSSIASVSGGPFYDGTYSVSMQEVQASNGVTYLSSTATGVTIDFYTVPSSLTAPVAGSTYNTLPVAFDLPQTPEAGAVRLILTNQSTNAVTTLGLSSTQDQSFTLSPGNLGGGSSATVASGPSSLADGTYSVVLSYANSYGEPTASSTPLTWTLDTTTQAPQAPSVTGGMDGSAVEVSYELPEAALPGTVELIFTGSSTTLVSLSDHTAGSHTLTLDPSDLGSSSDVASVSPANTTLPDGSYTVALAYQDALGNPVSTSPDSALTVSPVPASSSTTTTPTPTTPTPTTTTSPTPTTARGEACPAASGRLSGRRLGPLVIGMTRASARAMLPRYVTSKGFDRFCLLGGHAVSVAYASSRLLAGVPTAQRAPLRGRIVLALTNSPFYTLRSITPGATLSAARSALHLSAPLRIGANSWYFVPGTGVDGVLEVRDGVVDEIGIAARTIAAAGVRARTMRSL